MLTFSVSLSLCGESTAGHQALARLYAGWKPLQNQKTIIQNNRSQTIPFGTLHNPEKWSAECQSITS